MNVLSVFLYLFIQNTNEVMDESYCFETLEANVVDHMKFKADLRSKENLLQGIYIFN